MGAKAWQHVVVRAPIGSAPDAAPEQVMAGRVRLEIRHETTAEGAFWGKQARRFRSVWTDGGHKGAAYVEFRPHSRDLTEVVVHLASPESVIGSLTWRADRLNRAALGLALALRREIDSRAPAAGGKVPAARTA
jgi:hypothetical protein